MPLDIVVGAQWGDEGKGRIVDLLSAGADVVARFNGGDNAGHTVTALGRTFKLHQIPSGIIHPHTLSIMGGGMVINPASLMEEMDRLVQAGSPVDPQRLRISHAAHMITPGHRLLDRAREASLGKSQIGTTGRGIGPAYTDKVTRTGIRMQDMQDISLFEEKLTAHIEETNRKLEGYGASTLETAPIIRQYLDFAARIAPFICDTGITVYQSLQENQRVLAEGAQGTLLDLDHGSYPFVTSSSCIAPGALTSLGIGIQPVERVIGVVKAFQTRVGAGPFPTELSGEAAERLRGSGSNPWDEFGTTTGRPRRVGWLDLVLLAYAVRVNGLNELAITKLDILSGLSSIPICTAYRIDGKEYAQPPAGLAAMETAEPVYEILPGWQADIRHARNLEDLPAEARHFISRLEELSKVPVCWISVGPERDQIIRCGA